jgi:hypothetical protein
VDTVALRTTGKETGKVKAAETRVLVMGKSRIHKMEIIRLCA